MEIACVITAGGKARRLKGKIKAFIPIDGERIIDKNLNILKVLFKSISIISNHPEQFSEYSNYNIYSDIYKDIGPLAGLHTALRNIDSNAIFLISSDLPYLSSSIIKKLLTEYKKTKPDAIIPKIDNFIEPLYGIYSSSIIDKLESFIEEGNSYAIKNFLKTIYTQYLALDNTEENRKAFYNINTYEDLVD